MKNAVSIFGAIALAASAAHAGPPPSNKPKPKVPAAAASGAASGGGSYSGGGGADFVESGGIAGPAAQAGGGRGMLGRYKPEQYAYGLAKEGLPKGAHKSKLSPAEVKKRIASGKIRPIHKNARVVVSKPAHAAGKPGVQQMLAQIFHEEPRVLDRYLHPKLDAHAVRLRDGSIRHSFVDKKGKRHEVTSISPERRLMGVAMAKKALSDPRSRAHLYEALHAHATRWKARLAPAKQAAFGKLPAAATLRNGSLSSIEANLKALVGILLGLSNPPDNKPANYPASCANEEGAGTITAASGDMTSGGAPTGLFAKASWPLKWTNTCVRDQGHRNSCVAFSVTAAVESKAAAKRGRWLNLSEQDLYKHDKLDWSLPDPTLQYKNDDGYVAPVSLLSALVLGYRFPWEKQWNYNPARSRDSVTLANSCVNYTDANVGCSDTSHEAALQCQDLTIPGVGTNVCVSGHFSNWICDWQVGDTCLAGHFDGLPDWVCDQSQYVGTQDTTVQTCWYETDVSGGSGVGVSGFAPIAAGFITQPQLDLAKAALDAQSPIVLGFNDTPCFDDATAHGGFVQFQAGEGNRGGHAVLVTGYVDNANLPAGTPQGSGGGYFIIKNSWGPGFGDGGYAYMPYDYVKTYGDELTAITDVSL